MYDGLFCVSLYASDTGRVANIGTIMKLISMDPQYNQDGSIARIVVTCSPIQRVKIVKVENPSAWSQKSRIVKSDEYLMAYVEPYLDNYDNDETVNESDLRDIVDQIFQDYAMVRFTYKSQDAVAVGTLPPFAVKAMQEVPSFSRESLFESEPRDGEDTFWSSVEKWQNLCYTIREAKRVNIQSDMNELMIEEAMKKEGPLNLPVHKEDLPIDVQRELERMEQAAVQEFMDSGMDPCLDFQNLLSCQSHRDRLKLFSGMVLRERQRLETKKKLSTSFEDKNDFFQ